MGRITTHVLDTAAGKPAAGMRLVFRSLDLPDDPTEAVTNQDGRVDTALLDSADFRPGHYEILFHVGAYFRSQGMMPTDPPFLDIVPVRFGLAENVHYHVPLLVSPYGYSTYRGS
jgi:hydroxyisourate hydrolase